MREPSAGAIALRLMSMEVARRQCALEVSCAHLLVALCELVVRDDESLRREGQRLNLSPNAIERMRWERRVLREAFRELGLPPGSCANSALASMGLGPDRARTTRTYHRDDACRAVYRDAERLARQAGSLAVEPLHLLWSLAHGADPTLMSLLTPRGLTAERLAQICARVAQQHYTPAELQTRPAASAEPPPTEPDPPRPPLPTRAPLLRQPSAPLGAPHKAAPGGFTPVQADSRAQDSQTSADTPLLDDVGKDLTALAREGKLQPVVGMEPLVLQICQGLVRMDKGAVLLLGEPGVGKTAAVEAFAQAIVDGTLPGVLGQRLGKTRLIEVPLGALVAGTGLRGQFEERVQQLLAEARRHLETLVIFIDEIHLMMGAGSTQQGGMDVGNLLKPAMSRGELRLIGATTPDECARTLERDPAVMRRWEQVFVDEPDAELTLSILRGLKGRFSAHYRLIIKDDALKAVVEYAQRHLHDRRQPARSLDVLHEACAHMMCTHSAQEHWKDPTWTTPAPARLELTRPTVAEVVARRCRLPLSRVQTQDIGQRAVARAALEQQIFGQPEAIEAVLDVMTRATQGLTAPDRPDGVLLLAGPPGTGKRSLAAAVARALYGERVERFVHLDMAEFTDSNHAARLLGPPAGYVGHEQGGALTEPIRQQPCSVLLLENIDLATPDVLKHLGHLFDTGLLKDGQGRLVSFRQTLIFMSVCVSHEPARLGIGVDADDAQPEAHRRQTLRAAHKLLTPNLRRHIDHEVVFSSLSDAAVRRIADKLLDGWRVRLQKRGLALKLTENAYTHLITHSHHPTRGADGLRALIERGVVQAIADVGLQSLGGDATVDADETRGFFVAAPRPHEEPQAP